MYASLLPLDMYVVGVTMIDGFLVDKCLKLSYSNFTVPSGVDG